MDQLYTRLQEIRKQLEVPWEVLERDYILSWILAGISQAEPLKDSLIFKGGTALKKCYFGDYRFSEDLDFSGTSGIPIGNKMENAMQEACGIATTLLDEYVPIEIICERYTEKNPHPGNQEAFSIRCRFPWQRQLQTTVMVEITTDEKILQPVNRKTVIHEYGEPLEASIQAYSLEEIFLEKLRAILQHTDKLKKRGWGRSRARDYYDLWRILRTYRDSMDFSDFPVLLRNKCDAKDVEFFDSADFFQETMINYVEKTWDKWLGKLVPGLPSFHTILDDLRPQIKSIVG